jgi:hypothetical protein
MTSRATCLWLSVAFSLAGCGNAPPSERVSTLTTNAAVHGVHKVKHVIIVMQENHSFDNCASGTTRRRDDPGRHPPRAMRGFIVAAFEPRARWRSRVQLEFGGQWRYQRGERDRALSGAGE